MKLAIRAGLLGLFAAALIRAIGPAVIPSTPGIAPGAPSGGADQLTPAAGEAIFWGKGRCGTCHSVGDRGGERRCPNLGAASGLPAIGARAEGRAQEIAESQHRSLSAADYLVESMLSPTAFVVAGFKPEMPAVMKPPLSLVPADVRAIVVYLQSLGGSPDPAAIRIPESALAAAREVPAWAPYLTGDAARGERIFFDAGGVACATCHRIGERGGQVGPDLTHIGAVRGAREIIQSILEPSLAIASGFDAIRLESGQRGTVTGIVVAENETSVTLALATGAREAIPKSEIESRAPLAESIMPSNFRELLRVDELHDLVAYLAAQR